MKQGEVDAQLFISNCARITIERSSFSVLYTFFTLQGGVRVDNFTPKLRHVPYLAIERSTCERNLRNIKKYGSFFKLLQGVVCAKRTATQDTCHVSTAVHL